MALDLYAPDAAGAIPWPASPDGDLARRWLGALLRDGATAHVANVDARVFALAGDGLAMPVTVVDGAWDNCFVAGPYGHYVTYAAEELRTLDTPALELALHGVIAGLGLGLRLGELNRVAIANNWLLSTNLHPPLDVPRLNAVSGLLSARFPDHAIAFRSVAGLEDDALPAAFRQAGWLAVPSRQVWWQRPGEAGGLDRDARKAWKRDFRLVAEGPYEVVPARALDDAALGRVRGLYEQLYLGKYSTQNPRFTDRFFQLARDEGTLLMQALRHRETGAIDGVMGSFWRNGLLTTPVFGYDLAVPREAGLYRMLSALVYRAAEERGLIAHQSSGAAEFKRTRGAKAAIEYTFVWPHHLPPWRVAPWVALAATMETVVVPLMKAYRF